ncbi:hypothetical protein Y032_0552g3341 [Ancylostoma ceylanicum]|nr:hypothetical protein Y032_0552g3341 [Ancylostoma ceylanicum]
MHKRKNLASTWQSTPPGKRWELSRSFDHLVVIEEIGVKHVITAAVFNKLRLLHIRPTQPLAFWAISTSSTLRLSDL